VGRWRRRGSRCCGAAAAAAAVVVVAGAEELADLGDACLASKRMHDATAGSRSVLNERQEALIEWTTSLSAKD